MTTESIFAAIARIKASDPQNLAIQAFDTTYFQSLSPELQTRLLGCINSGLENADSEMGCYAGSTTDYDDLRPFFSRVLSAHHRVPADARHTSSWDLSACKRKLGIETFDLDRLGLPALSTRIRVGRNLEDFPLPPAMNKQQRISLENRMAVVFEQLNQHRETRGNYYSLTPGHISRISTEEHAELVDRHLMFKDMSSDPYLKSAGISADWPNGRGCFIGEQRDFIIWVGEEDHLRIMCMELTTRLGRLFDRLKIALDQIEGSGNVRFARSEDYGNITSCPTNLGTGMRASVHLPLPLLTQGGNLNLVKKIAKQHGLAVRGMGGEHTPIGSDGTVDLSPSARFCITEAEILTSLYQGIEALAKAERELEI